MLTYLPLYFQGGLATTPIAAGLLMLHIAARMFVVRRLISKHFAHRASGRTLLTVGLTLVTIGLFGMALVAPALNYSAMLAAMFVSGY